VQLDKSTLVDEIMALWKGPAARDPSRLEQLGPQLRHACGITDQDTPRQMGPKLRGAIEQMLDDRPELKISLLARLGLHPGALHKTPGRRLDWAASQIGYSARTTGRRAETARDAFAQLAAATANVSPMAAHPGFILRSFRGDLILTGDRPRFVERREITVTVEELPAIPAAFAILLPAPGYEPTFDIAVTSGGTECYDIQRRMRAVRYLVRPYRPLMRGETHGFEVELSLPDWCLLASHYVLAPRTKIHSSDVSVVFNPIHLPDSVWRVNGALPGEVDHCPPDGPDQLDPSGRLCASFRSIEQGCHYGIAWSWASSVGTDDAAGRGG
jgi:hypothetical protein